MDGSRIVVTSGHPTERELAAIVVALTAHAQSAVAPANGRPSGWVRATRLEGRGHQPIDDRTRLLSY